MSRSRGSVGGSTSAAAASGFLPEVQALRALGVAFVVIFHLWPRALPGGYVGVDAFFVISGFLISGHLLREVEATGTVDLPAFWARRVRRLLPASLLVLGATTLGVAAWVPATSMEQFLSEIAAAGAYFLNFKLAHDAVDYWADGAPSPVQHYWSLSVEEQFYLVWPVLFFALAKLGRKGLTRKGLVAVLALLGALSLAASIRLTHLSPASAYFVTPTRVWEFAVGAWLALGPLPRLSARVRAALGWLGLALLGAAGLCFSKETPFPGFAALLPVVGSGLVVLAGKPDAAWAPSRWADARLFRWLGDISYSLYLWHWPLFVLWPYLPAGLAELPGFRWIVLALSLVLAVLTKRFVEDPIRSGTLARRRSSWSFGIAALVTGSLLGSVALLQRNFERRPSAVSGERWAERAKKGRAPACFGAASSPAADTCKNPELANVLTPAPSRAKRDRGWTTCMVEEADSTVRVCETGLPASEARQTVALVGDSHAEQWIPTLDMLAKSRGWHILRILKSKCSFNAAAPDLSPRARDSCATWNRDVAKELARRPEISELFVSSSSFNAYVAEPGQKWQEIAARGYRTSWAALPGHIARIHVLRDVPRPRPDVIQCLERLGSDEARLAPGACARPAKEALLWDPLVSAAADEPRADVIDLSSRFCNANSCWPVIGHVLVYRDKSHLGATFARSLAPFLERELDRLALPGAAKGR